MILKSLGPLGTIQLVQTITDQILLTFNGLHSQSVLRVWHISQKEDALIEWEKITK
tara:strand:- start:253 stop:420 length:168 start_codon:yes stop_codon:yes gene_type:complete